jgi:acylpyruvate hydrolase
MQLVTFRHVGLERLGVLHTEQGTVRILDLNRAAPELPDNMTGWLAAGQPVRELTARILQTAAPAAWLRVDEVALIAPVPRPGKILCVGRNYAEHAAEGHAETPKEPVIFAKYANTINAPGAPIVLHSISSQIDYEGELAVVIGRQARNVAEADALGYVGGYTALNDVSARDLQFLTSQWTIGKTLDGFAPMGPALVTADEITDPQSLSLRTLVNGEVVQSANTRTMIFSVAFLIAWLSRILTLEPGDVISTGTPSGVGHYHHPPRYLQPGDIVRIEIDGIGALENPVVADGSESEH